VRSAGAAVAIALLAVAAGAGCLERGKKREKDPAPPAARDAAPKPAPAPIAPIARAEPDGRADPTASIRVRLEAEPAHLNPLLGDALAARVLLGDVYEGLVCRAREIDEPEPCLAIRWSVSAGGKRWRFELRPGVRFHDGAALAPADVIASIELAARSTAPTLLRADFDDLVAARPDGDGAVVIEFSRHRVGRLEAFARLPILSRPRFAGASPARLASHPASREPVGTGALRFASHRRGERITLRRNPDYWGRAARTREVVYEIVGSRERAYAMIRRGELDLAPQLPLGEALDLAAGVSGYDLYSYRRPAYLAAVYNTRNRWLGSDGRRALTALLDRSELIRALFDNRAAPITGPFVGGDVNPAIEPIPFDRDRARSDLGPEARIEILVPAESRTMAQIADIWASDAAGVVELVPRPLPYAAVLERARSGDFDIALLAFTTGPDLDMYHRLHSSQRGAENYGGLEDPALDGLLERARAATDREERRRLTRQVHERIHELQPYAFIASDVRAGVVRSDIGGIDAGDGLAARFLWREVRGR
jgi:peptide/nickel transport system substrate-binding protein